MLPILNQSLWRDEAFSVLLSEKSPLEIIRLTMHDVAPPLYYILLHYWMIFFGDSEVVMRSLSFLFHLLTVFVVYLLARNLIKSAWGQLLITTATLLNPFLLQYSFEARPYTLLAFLAVLAIFMVSTRKYFTASIVLAVGILTHNFGVFTFTAFAFWWLYHNRQNFQVKKALTLTALPILSILLWGGIIWSQWVKVTQGFWIQQTTSSIFLHSLEIYSKGDLSYSVQPMLYTLTLILLFFAFSYWVWKERKEENPTITLIFFVALIPMIITYLISALFTPIYHERYLIATAPLLIILVGYSLYKLYESNNALRNLTVAFIAIYTMVLIQSSEQIIASSTKPAINYGVNQILSKASDNDVIVPQNNLNFLETKYYVKRSGRNLKVYAYAPDGKIPFYIGSIIFESREIITAMPKNQRVWQIKPDGGYE